MNRKHVDYISTNNNVRRPWVKEIALIIALITITVGEASANDPIFSEGGGAVPYALEEEILEELAKGHDKNDERDFVGISSSASKDTKQNVQQPEPVQPSPTKESPSSPAPQRQQQVNQASSLDASKQMEDMKSAAAAFLKQSNSILKNQEPAKPKQKKEGQEEFATFVDPFSAPAQNHRLAAEKPKYGGQHQHFEEKRASHSGKGDGQSDDMGDTVFIAVTTVCSAAAVFGLMGAGVCWYRLHKQYKAAQDAEYPHYGVTGPAKERTSSGQASPVQAMDAKLASSAQLYHYQHTKQQIIAMEHSTSDAKGQESDDSEGEGDEGDYSVYECPGLAPTGDIEVSNPLFENVASPHTKSDPRRTGEESTGQEGGAASPRVHHRSSPVRGEDP
jgi:hypothetical protein